VKVGEHVPPEWFYVHDQMDEFLTILHRKWVSMDVLEAAAYTLWAINHIHPFCDGNGRTSRALCYFVLCRKLRDWVRGSTTIMELIRTESRDQYCDILKRMDAAKGADMMTDLTEMTAFLNDLVLKQIRTAPEIEG
jgi:Fic family protein